MTLGNKIKQLRENKKYSQEELADLLKVHSVTISKWENGTQEPRAKRLSELAKALNTSVEYLMGLTDDAPPETPQISLPINNMEKENKISNDDLDLGFWGSIVERAERAARSNDNGKKALIAGMLDMAKKAITGSEGKPATATINAYNGDHSSYNGNIFNAGKA